MREGWLTPAADPKPQLPPRRPIPGYTLEQLMRELDEDRADCWPIPEEHWTPAFRALIERIRKNLSDEPAEAFGLKRSPP
jgi:hypothetical protein